MHGNYERYILLPLQMNERERVCVVTEGFACSQPFTTVIRRLLCSTDRRMLNAQSHTYVMRYDAELGMMANI